MITENCRYYIPTVYKHNWKRSRDGMEPKQRFDELYFDSLSGRQFNYFWLN